MTTESRLDRAASIAGAVLRAVAHALVRTAVYLGPLLLEAAGLYVAPAGRCGARRARALASLSRPQGT